MLEMNSSGTVTAINAFGPDGLVARQSGGNWTYYTFDQQGNVAVRQSSDGTITSRSTFDAYGAEFSTGSPSDPYAYNGQWGYYYDREIGLYYCQNRFYDPSQGRWLNRDPIGYEGGANLYGYCGGGPVGRADPSGLLTANDYWSEVGNVFRGYGDVLNLWKQAENLGYIWAQGEMHGAGTAFGLVWDGLVNTVQFWNATDSRDFGNRFGGTLLLAAPAMKRLPSFLNKARAVDGPVIARIHPVTGVPFDEAGFPIFDDWCAADVNIGASTGSRRGNYKAANAAAGLSETPPFATWHHHQDVGRMQLVPRSIHGPTSHVGGWSIWGIPLP